MFSVPGEFKKINTRHHWCRVDRGGGSGVMPAVVLGDLNQCNGMNTDMTRCVYIDVAVLYICMQAHRCLTSLPMQAVRHPRSSVVGLSIACVHIHVWVSCASNNSNIIAANMCGGVGNANTWYDTHTSPQSLLESSSSGAVSGLLSSNFTTGRLRLALRTALPPISAASKIPGVTGAAT